jgi:parallel beta-helix repeat protein
VEAVNKALLSLACFVFLAGLSGDVSAATIYVPDDYPTIQAAVDAANVGDTIIVRDGTYTENIDVNKSLTIKSENGAEATIVQAANPNDHIFEVTANYVNVSGFSVKGATGTASAGIYLNSANYGEISNNKLSDNNWGIATRTYWSSDNNIIMDNICENNDRGIFISYASSSNSITNNICQNNNIGLFLAGGNNVVTGNTFENNTQGILLYYSDGDNTLIDNIMAGNAYNFNIVGFDLYQYIHNIDVSNKVDGKPIYYLVNEQDKQIPSDAGYVAVVDSTNIIVENLTLTNNNEGVLFAYSTNSRVENTNAIGNYFGIRLHRSSNNTITNSEFSTNYHGIFLYYASNNVPSTINNDIISNNVSSNEHGITIWDYAKDNSITFNNISHNEVGIYARYSAGVNYVYLNNILYNTDNARADSANIVYNSPEEITYTHNGTTYTNYLGNYWSDYNGSDADGDGIGDSPYSIDGDSDDYPLMEPWENYIYPTVNNPPDLPTSLSQLKSDGVTEILEGGTTTEGTVVFKGTVSDPDGDEVRLEIELRQIDEPFTGEPTPETISDFVSSGTEVTITRYGLVDADYHWQYRAKDSRGTTSKWKEFKTPGNIDFTVETPIADGFMFPVLSYKITAPDRDQNA